MTSWLISLFLLLYFCADHVSDNVSLDRYPAARFPFSVAPLRVQLSAPWTDSHRRLDVYVDHPQIRCSNSPIYDMSANLQTKGRSFLRISLERLHTQHTLRKHGVHLRISASNHFAPLGTTSSNSPVYGGANKLCGSKPVDFSSVESGASSRPSNHLLSHTDAVLTLPDGLTSRMISHYLLLCDPRLAEIGPASVSFSRLSASL